MGIIELLLLAVSLSMDAFAVSICQGLSMDKINHKKTLAIGLYFGSFQALMPLLGWAVGTSFQRYITSIDHWIAFILLAIIGGNMVLESRKDDSLEDTPHSDTIDHKELFLLAIATSIDALTVGIMFAFLKVSIMPSVGTIGVCTLLLSMVGVYIGHRFGSKYKSKAECLGGIVLILIGLKVLLEHLGVL